MSSNSPLRSRCAAKQRLKFNNKDAELKAVREYLSKNIATATMCAVDLNIYRPNLCRYKAILKERSHLVECYTRPCKITGHPAAYLTCNPILVKAINVMKGVCDG